MAFRKDFELKVGIFVFIGLLILSIAIFSIGDLEFFKPGYYIEVRFRFASGIDIGAPVRLAGVEVGEVKKIEIFYNEEIKKTQVALSVWLEKSTKVPQDSEAHINTLGLLGEKYLEILPGRDYSHLLADGDILVGTDPVSMGEIVGLGREIAVKLNYTIESINDIVGDVPTKEALKGAISNLNDLTQDLRGLIERATTILDKVKNGEGTMGKLLMDEALYYDIKYLTEDLKRHPWKLLRKGKSEDREKEEQREKR